MTDEVTQRIRILLEASTQKADRDMRKSARELLGLQRAYDPVSAAAQKYARAEGMLKRQLEAGRITLDQHDDLLRKAGDAYGYAMQKAERAAVAMGRMGTQATGLTGFMARNRTVVQQAGFQIGDFAVQVAGGTSAITAFSQQGSQLLGAFGAVGAVGGAAVAILAPLAAGFLTSADNAEAFSDALDKLNDSLSDLKDAEGLSRSLGLRQAELDAAALADALRGIVDPSDIDIERGVGGQIRRQLQLAGERAAYLNARIEEAANAEGYRAQAEGLKAANLEVIEMLGGIDAMEPAQLAVVRAVNETADAYLNLGNEVARTAQQIEALAFAGQQRAASLGFSTPLQDALSDFDAPEGGLSFSRGGGGRSSSSGSRRTGRGGGRSASAQLTAEQREVQRIIQQTRTEVERYNIELARLNDLHARGQIDADTFERAIAQLDEGLANTRNSTLDLQSSMADTFASIITGSASASDALNNLAGQILGSVTQNAVGSLFNAIPGLGNLNLGGIFGARAIGGPVSAGQSYLVGERGPEIITPRGNGTVTPNGAMQPVEVNVYAPAGTNPQVSRGPGGSVEVLIESVTNGLISRGRFDGSLGNRFGLRQQPAGG